jgi:uncharacterized repeat protein (TIGR03803 family)
MHLHRKLTLLALAAATLLAMSARAAKSTPMLNVIYSFTNGASPNACVVIGTNGSFYGTTATGGPGNFGGIFEVTSNGILTNMIWLNGTNGATPLGPLIQGRNGNFYGTASSGGFQSNGTIFEITAAGEFKLLDSFDFTNGSNPMGALLEATNGWFYGTAFDGGSNHLGSIFRFQVGEPIGRVYSFDGTNGENPAAGLMQGAGGDLYGTTEYGGANGLGTVFQLTYAGALTNLCSFTDETGAFPGSLVEGSAGNFYGPTISGGADLDGTIFSLNTFGLVQTLFTFDGLDGAKPNSPFVLGDDGNWYGTTAEGGAFGQGTVFRFNSRGLVQADLISFNGSNGALPASGLVAGSDGNLYGTTSSGGAYGFGEIYQLTGFAPFIITPPLNQKWASNATAQFSVVVGGSAPLSYQWLFDSTNVIPGATNASLVVAHERLANSGTYTVIVSNAFGVTNAEAVLSVAAPAVTIAAVPATVTNASRIITGTASDPNGIASVLCQLNGNGWFAALGTTSWQTNVTLQPGSNTFQAESLDPLDNPSAIKTVSIFYSVISPITLQSNGLGSIHAEFTATNLILDRSYSVRAMPASGWLFASWAGSASGTNNPLSFVMQSNFTLTANFVTNPFIAAAGTYAGLFVDTNAVAEQSAGLVNDLVIQTSGAYSGQLFIKGLRHNFSGNFDVSEQSITTVGRTAAQGGPLAMNLTLNGNELTGTVNGIDDDAWASPLLAERVGKFNGSGEYTMLIPPGQGPPGDGYVLVTNHNGAVTLSGATADGAAISQSVPLVGAGDLPFYTSLYSNTGLLIGWLNLDGSLTATNLWWIKPASSTTALYPGGFTNIVTNVLTSAWTNPPVNYLQSVALTISNTNLALDFIVSITNNTVVKETGSPTNSLTGTFNPKTGLLKITFGNGAGKATTTGYAAILQDSTNGGGYFLTKTNAGAILWSP